MEVRHQTVISDCSWEFCVLYQISTRNCVENINGLMAKRKKLLLPFWKISIEFHIALPTPDSIPPVFVYVCMGCRVAKSVILIQGHPQLCQGPVCTYVWPTNRVNNPCIIMSSCLYVPVCEVSCSVFHVFLFCASYYASWINIVASLYKNGILSCLLSLIPFDVMINWDATIHNEDILLKCLL